MFTREDFLSKMHVEEIDTLLYRGDPLQMDLPKIFGGQVLGQALNAAVRTVDPARRPHSLHGYFLRPGDITRPIIYEVDPIRDGRSFSTRRVVGKQKGEAIFNASISFQILEDGLSHQIDLPDHVPSWDSLINDLDYVQTLSSKDDAMSVEYYRKMNLLFGDDIVEFRTPNLAQHLRPESVTQDYGFWFKFHDGIGDDPITHRTLLAFISDKGLMGTALRHHAISFLTHKIIGASLDHAMWFHADIRIDDWVYYHIDSPRSSRARGLNRGSFYNKDGMLIASTAQEGLMRVIGKKDDA